MTGLTPAMRLSWWATAWLRGRVGPDDLLDAVLGDDVTHVVVGHAGLLETLLTLRREGATGVGLALPVEGDLVGLGGPREFNDDALEATEAVVVASVQRGLVPRPLGPTVEWRLHTAHRRQLLDVGDADRELRSSLLSVADELAALDVAQWRPEVADQLSNLRHRPALEAPPGIPARCRDLAARGLQAREIADLAAEDDGGALSAMQAQRRRDAIDPLARAARRALVAAFSPEVWPPE